MSGQTERKLKELSFLQEVAQLAASARDWDEMLRIVIERSTDAMGAEVSSLYLLEKTEGVLRLVATNGLNRGGIGRATLRLGEGIVGWVANARVPLAVRDVRTEPRWKWVPEVDEKRFTSMLSVPVIARDEVIGVMNVQTVEPRDFGREEIDFLQTIANQVAGIIEKGRMQRESDRKLREVSALFEVSNVLTSTLDLDEVLALVVDRLVRVYPGASGAILLREEGEDRERARSGELQRVATQAAHRAIVERRPIVAFDLIAMPLIANDRLLGAVVLQVPDYKEFSEEEVRFVGALANQAALAIDKASLYALEQKTTESLRELERARADFVAVVTHDLRTPLSVIRGYLDLLADKNGKSKVPVSEATAQVERLDHLVDRILAGVRTDRPELAMRRTRFDLRATVAGALKEVAPMARKHKLTGPRAGQAVFVRGDRRRTAEVVAGLVHNATKYAPPGTRIGVRIERGDVRAIVRVQDEGPGVPPAERGRIFEPYARGTLHDEVPGSGIGLFASRRVIEGQGGDLWVEDAPEGGAVFAFSIPLARAPTQTPTGSR
ncbi:MAG TPA: GAF domain-containing protein [Candidatus Limnocylindria bacterium]|jgi:two-component system sensor histidine kinase KdpD|nr:GAF domain-containing protein [Candidatus Limnocylindria bacterium]